MYLPESRCDPVRVPDHPTNWEPAPGSPRGPGNAVPDGQLCAAQRLTLAGGGGNQQQRQWPFRVKIGGLFPASHHLYLSSRPER